MSPAFSASALCSWLLLVPAAPAAAQSPAATCDAPLELTNDGRAASLPLEKGIYTITLADSSQLNCEEARQQLRIFLAGGEEPLPEPWTVDRATGTFTRGETAEPNKLAFTVHAPATAADVDSGASFFDDVENWAVIWLPIIFMGLIAVVLVIMLKHMPRTKPQEIKPRVLGVHLAGTTWPASRRPRTSCARWWSSCATPKRFRALGRQGAQGHPAARPARHGQDAAGQGRGARVQRQVLRPVGLLVRGDVRRAGRLAHPAAVPRGAQGGARHRLHRRAGRRGRHPRQRRLRREGPDAEPAAGGARRLRRRRQRWWSSPPPTCWTSSTPRCCARAASTARSSSPRPTSRAASRSCVVHTPGQAAGQDERGPGADRPPDQRPDRRRPGQHLQRGRDLRRPRPPRPRS